MVPAAAGAGDDDAHDPLPPLDQFGPRPTRLEPGLYAVSASLVRGLPWRVYDNARWAPYSAWTDAFGYFRRRSSRSPMSAIRFLFIG